MILAAAQTHPHATDIAYNLAEHCELITAAAAQNADLIVFPELSITSYHRTQAATMALSPQDPRLEVLQRLAVDKQIIIIAGAPLFITPHLYLASLIFLPDGSRKIYTKQYLHAGEDLFYQSSFHYNPLLTCQQEKIALAICADIDHPEHPQQAHQDGGSIYLASIFFSLGGIKGAYQNLSSYAQTYAMPVLMSNYCGTVWDTESAGRSAFWNERGELVASLDQSTLGLLLVERKEGVWEEKK